MVSMQFMVRLRLQAMGYKQIVTEVANDSNLFTRPSRYLKLKDSDVAKEIPMDIVQHYIHVNRCHGIKRNYNHRVSFVRRCGN